jgi:hypothetical protein
MPSQDSLIAWALQVLSLSLDIGLHGLALPFLHDERVSLAVTCKVGRPFAADGAELGPLTDYSERVLRELDVFPAV